MTEEPKKANRLIYEKSPYLLQHAYNPVDWYPWGEEAFQRALSEDKPIFLSIGYATCHWCHVMEKESFEDSEIAVLLNDSFVCIKVDREELPEVDSLYMEFAQSMMAGASGWPLNVILTPDLKPFFSITYLPPRTRDGMMGLVDLIHRINEVWRSDEREDVLQQADKIVQVFSESVHLKGDKLPEETIVGEAVELFYKMVDPVYGGLKGEPKFPIPYQSTLLMNYSFMQNDSRALFVVEKTLDMMQRGGIYDHLGGGFSRYSVDDKWIVPHFEKMLYDNALLAGAYLDAWKMTKRELYKNICEDILLYITREMSHPDGGFYSAQDADSEGIEGFYYTWTVEEIESVLEEEDAPLFCEFFSVDHIGDIEGRNILYLSKRPEELITEDSGMTVETFIERIAVMKSKLLEVREKRVHPLKDDKIITSWNGLMIHSFAEAGAAYGDPSYLEEAVRAATFIRENLWDGQRLLRRWREGEADFNAGLDEYAFLIRGLLSLFEVDCGIEWFQWAVELNKQLSLRFKSPEGGYYLTDGSDQSLIIRNCQYSDGAEPSGNAIQCENLIRFYQLTYDPQYLQDAGDILMAVKKYLETYSPGYGYHLLNVLRFYNRLAPTIVVALNEEKEHYDEIYEKIFQSFIPHRAVVWRKYDDEELFHRIPFASSQIPIDGKTTVYICHDRVCEKPLTDIEEIRQAL